jgi:hypothetical protein
MNKKIFLAGDICEDWLLFDNNMLPNGINENLRPEYGRGTIFHSLPGGVLLLKSVLIRSAAQCGNTQQN